MKIRHLFSMLAIAFFALGITACDDDNGDGPEDPQEVITTVRLNFFDGVNTLTFTASDPDGDGGDPPVVDSIVLLQDTSYQITVEFLDESMPGSTVDITEEVEEEAEEHIVCMGVSGNLPVPDPTDQDANGDVLGLEHVLVTEGPATGQLLVVLRHEPDKSLTNPCNSGETDAEVIFNVRIE